MSTRQNRRRFLRACAAAGAAGAAAGCVGRAGIFGDGTDGGDGDDNGNGGEDNGENGDERVDDWVYFAEDDSDGFWSGTPSMGMGTGATLDAAEADSADSIGLAAGGAADVGTFRRNIREGYLPIPESIAYEGLFHEYYFDTGGVEGDTCDSLFCPTYTPAVSRDPLSGDEARYLSVGLDSGMSKDEFERPPLNLVVVLDISGSMSASFDDYYYDVYGGRYYYDEHGNRQEVEEQNPEPKMEVAKEALVSLTEHLRPDDRLGVVLFNHQAHLAKPVRRVGDTDMDAIRGHIREEVHAGGGTNISAAMEMSDEVLDDADEDGRLGSDGYETRSVLVTDAQINWGETDADELRNSLQENAEEGHHTSVVGVGVDFNADLIQQITQVKGANYYSVYTQNEFDRRMDEEFEYMVSPLVFDLSLELHTDGWEIEQVYGSPGADDETGEMMSVDTLFPSPSEGRAAKGGVVLAKISKGEEAADSEGNLSLEASWETHEGDQRSATDEVELPDEVGYGNDAVRKAVLLSRYADLMKNWTLHERENRDGTIDARTGDAAVRSEGDADTGTDTLAASTADEEIVPPPTPPYPPRNGLSQWEQQSVPLTVTEPYETRISEFQQHLEAEIDEIGDDDLRKEVEMIDEILENV